MVLLSSGLLSAQGIQHKKQRKPLNPVFSSSQLGDMSQIFYRVAHKVCLSAHRKCYKFACVNGGPGAERDQCSLWPKQNDGITGRERVEGKDDVRTLEILGQAALGYSFDNFAEDPTDQYGESVKLFL